MSSPDSTHTRRDLRTTHWSVVLRARAEQAPAGTRALEQLCATYWYPLYAFVRRKGYGEEEAKGLTQRFFTCLLGKKGLETVGSEKGKFRTFLLGALNNFLANERDWSDRKKRTRDHSFISLDDEHAEKRYLLEPADKLTPERVYERRWAQAVVDRVLAQLRNEFAGAGKAVRFELLKVFVLDGPGAPSYAEAATRLNLTEQAIKSAIHRLRERFRLLFRVEIANTVASPDEIDQEIRCLFAALSGE